MSRRIIQRPYRILGLLTNMYLDPFTPCLGRYCKHFVHDHPGRDASVGMLLIELHPNTNGYSVGSIIPGSQTLDITGAVRTG